MHRVAEQRLWNNVDRLIVDERNLAGDWVVEQVVQSDLSMCEDKLLVREADRTWASVVGRNSGQSLRGSVVRMVWIRDREQA